MLKIRPKLFEDESVENHSLRFTQVCGIDHIVMIREYVNFIAKENSSELLKAFFYRDRLLLNRNVVTLWLAQSY